MNSTPFNGYVFAWGRLALASAAPPPFPPFENYSAVVLAAAGFLAAGPAAVLATSGFASADPRQVIAL